MTENLRLKITEGQAIEISDGSMWLPTNYDGSTTGVTTFTAADVTLLHKSAIQGGWKCSSPYADCTDYVRSFDTAGSSNAFICDPDSFDADGNAYGTKQCYENTTTSDDDTQALGIYYSWYAATGGQGTHDRSTNTTISICPKNWVMPKSNAYRNLINAYAISFPSDTDVQVFPFSFISGGLFSADRATPALQLSRGGYWTAEAVKPSGTDYYFNARYLYNQPVDNVFDQPAHVATSNTRKRNGATVRCIAK
ncbi:hypothetical protein IJG11_03425 [Candidatus Saccharibacteria bacterium]|nr:hypothetical protein [Candidatus Saccharibacteria bacterium]